VIRREQPTTIRKKRIRALRTLVTDGFETFAFAIVATSARPSWVQWPFTASWVWWMLCALAAVAVALDVVLLVLLLMIPAQVQAVVDKRATTTNDFQVFE
jgi:hypothetical protein